MTGSRPRPSVAIFSLDEVDASGEIQGYAAPPGGPDPCSLLLVAGQGTIATAPAVGYSAAAAEAGVRAGWCGFAMGGLAQAAALSGTVELRCAGTGRVLQRWAGIDLAARLKPPVRADLSVEDLRLRLHLVDGCGDVEQVLPLALDLALSKGRRAFLDATFRFFLKRPIDDDAVRNFLGPYDSADTIRACWRTVMSSAEYSSNVRAGLPGPFSRGFPFPLGALDAVV